jgi:hypothetical protein
MTTIGTGQVYVNDVRQTFTLYKAGSAEKHAASDDITLKAELIKALNLPAAKKEDQGGGVYRVRINQGKGYLVFLTPVGGVPNSASIFHYHWNYHLDLPLSAT